MDDRTTGEGGEKGTEKEEAGKEKYVGNEREKEFPGKAEARVALMSKIGVPQKNSWETEGCRMSEMGEEGVVRARVDLRRRT